jgi:hypothetical protein
MQDNDQGPLIKDIFDADAGTSEFYISAIIILGKNNSSLPVCS